MPVGFLGAGAGLNSDNAEPNTSNRSHGPGVRGETPRRTETGQAPG